MLLVVLSLERQYRLDRLLQDTLEDKSMQGQAQLQAYNDDRHPADNNELLQPNNGPLAILGHRDIQEYTLPLLCIHHCARYIHHHKYNQDSMLVQEHMSEGMSDQDAIL